MSDIAYKSVLPEGWIRPRGFSHAAVASGSRIVKIAGQLGKRPQHSHVSDGDDFGRQWHLAMENLVEVLRATGGEPHHFVMIRAYVTDMAEFNGAGAAIAEAWSRTLGRHFPAMTLLQIAALIDPNAKVEIEGEAVLP